MMFDFAVTEEDPIHRTIGSIGRWQIVVSLLIFLVKFPVAWQQLSIVLLAPPVDFSCADPNITDRCSDECHSHVFDTSVFTSTITSQWDLVCGRSQLSNVAQTIFMLGILFGNLWFGQLSDKYGRRKPLVAAVFLQLLSGVSIAFTTNFHLFLVLRFITAVATGGTMVTSFVLLMEMIGKQWRDVVGIVYQLPFNFGHLLLAVIGYFVRDWRYVQLAISMPSIVLISYYWILPESPRWLITSGRNVEATKILEKAAKCNKRSTAGIKDVVEAASKYKQADESHKGNILDLFKTPNLRRRTLCICFNWGVCGLCFFGLTQYLGQTQGNVFVNIAVSALATIPGTIVAIYVNKKFGRRNTMIGSNLLAGIPLICIAFMPSDWIGLRVFIAAVGIFGISLVFPTAYLYSGELFPTVIRNVGVGTSSMCARFGSMAAPFVAGLKENNEYLPPIIFGVVPLIGAFLCLYLPETVGTVLPDTLDEGERFGTCDGLKKPNDKGEKNETME